MLGSPGLTQPPRARRKTQLGAPGESHSAARRKTSAPRLQPTGLLHFAATTHPARYKHQLIENFTFPGTFVSLSFPSCQLQRTERDKLRGHFCFVLFFPEQNWDL